MCHFSSHTKFLLLCIPKMKLSSHNYLSYWQPLLHKLTDLLRSDSRTFYFMQSSTLICWVCANRFAIFLLCIVHSSTIQLSAPKSPHTSTNRLLCTRMTHQFTSYRRATLRQERRQIINLNQSEQVNGRSSGTEKAFSTKGCSWIHLSFWFQQKDNRCRFARSKDRSCPSFFISRGQLNFLFVPSVVVLHVL